MKLKKIKEIYDKVGFFIIYYVMCYPLFVPSLVIREVKALMEVKNDPKTQG